MTRWRTLLRGSRSERGAAAVEFAIVLTALLLILLGIIDFGRLLFVSQAVKSASREGARTAAIAGTVGNTFATSATNAGASARSLSGNSGSFTCKYQISNASGVFTPDPIDWVTQGTECADVTPPATPPCADPSNPQSVRVYTKVDFRWLTPVGAIPNLSNPGLSGTRTVGSTTTITCE